MSHLGHKEVESKFKEADFFLSGVEPLNFDLINALYRLLWEDEMKIHSEKQIDPDHPALLIKSLHTVFSFVEKNPTRAIRKTAGETFLGLGGSYFVQDGQNNIHFVFKPESEEIQNDQIHGIPVGQGAKREQVVYLLGKRQQVPIPATLYVKLGDQVGSLQRFVPHAVPLLGQFLSKLSVDEIQLIGVLDGRIKNGDRRTANFLLSENELGVISLLGIDHGSALSSLHSDPFRLDYLDLDQMKRPMMESVSRLLLGVDIEGDEALMKRHGLGAEPIRWMVQSTRFMQMSVEENLRLKRENKTLLTLSDLLQFENQARGWLPFANREQFLKVLTALGEWKQSGLTHLPYQIFHRVS